MIRVLKIEYFFGRFGKRRVDRIDDRINPDIAKVINSLVICGKLADKTVASNISPPISTGNQPIKAIIKALVAQE